MTLPWDALADALARVGEAARRVELAATPRERQEAEFDRDGHQLEADRLQDHLGYLGAFLLKCAVRAVPGAGGLLTDPVYLDRADLDRFVGLAGLDVPQQELARLRGMCLWLEDQWQRQADECRGLRQVVRDQARRIDGLESRLLTLEEDQSIVLREMGLVSPLTLGEVA